MKTRKFLIFAALLPLLLLPHPPLLLPQALLRSRLRCPATF